MQTNYASTVVTPIPALGVPRLVGDAQPTEALEKLSNYVKTHSNYVKTQTSGGGGLSAAFALVVMLSTATATGHLTSPAAAAESRTQATEQAIGVDSLSSRYYELRDELASFVDLPDNWDGYNGEAPQESTVEAAQQFLSLLPGDCLAPYAMVAGDGEVGFYWRDDERFINISFFDAEEAIVYARCSAIQHPLHVTYTLPMDVIDSALLEYIPTV